MKLFPLSHAQKRIWHTERITGIPAISSMGGVLTISMPLDCAIMQEVLNDIIRENDAFRIKISEKDGEIQQYISCYQREKIETVDFDNSPQDKERFQTWKNETFNRNISLDSKHLYHFAIFTMGDEISGVLVKLHHIIADGWSVGLVQKYICCKYEAYLANNLTNNLLPTGYTYEDYVGEETFYLATPKFEDNKRYWLTQFSDYPREYMYCSTENVQGNRLTFPIDSQRNEKIQTFLVKTGVSATDLYFCSTILYLHLTTGRTDFILGMPVHNRVGWRQKELIGMCTSTVPLRIRFRTSDSIHDLLHNIALVMKSGFRNQAYPYDMLINDLDIRQDGFDSLYSISVNHYNMSLHHQINAMLCKTTEHYFGYQSHSLQLVINEWSKDSVYINYDYKVDEWSEHSIHYMHKKMMYIIDQMMAGVTSVSQLQLYTASEVDYRLYQYNDTDCVLPGKTVYTLFADFTARTPDKIALYHGEKTFTYRQLFDAANQVAAYLLEKGIGAGSVVGIYMAHSTALIIAMLGTLKAGAAYLPIDLDCPWQRMHDMLDDCRCRILLTNHNTGINEYKEWHATEIDEIIRQSARDCEDRSNLNENAYIIYTSGTTGKPKGVAVSHLGLLNYIWWAQKTYLCENDIMAFYSLISFDLTVTSIFAPLVSGNAIDICEQGEADHAVLSVIARNKATVLKITPAHLHLLQGLINETSRIHTLIVGGEALKSELARNIKNATNGCIRIFNEYGPTEAVVGCMTHEYDPDKDFGSDVPIGKPIQNMKIYVLDDQLGMIPDGKEGEICISGRGIAHYVHADDDTEKFIPNPYCKGLRMYKSGDIGKFLKNGLLDYVGRKDQQVKIRGYRIELGELETCLLKYPGISNVVAKVIGDDENKNIVAYIICESNIDPDSLKHYLSLLLPGYMIPRLFQRIDAIPLLHNGKVDYASLAAPIYEQREFKPAATEPEKCLLRAINKVMGVGEVSVQSNFYEIGGDSIKAIQIASAVRKYGYKLKSVYLLHNHTLQETAEKMEAFYDQTKRDIRIGGSVKKTPIVKWFLTEYPQNRNCYDQYVALNVPSQYPLTHLNEAVHHLIAHHNTLCLNYNEESDELYYSDIFLRDDSLVVEELNLGDDVFVERIDINDLLQTLQVRSSLRDELLFRLYVVNDRAGEELLLFVAHHIVVDSVSWQILLPDFFLILDSVMNDRPIALPDKTDSYGRWSDVVYEYSQAELSEEVHYWNCIHAIGLREKHDLGPHGRGSFKKVLRIDKEMLAGAKEACNGILRMQIEEYLIIVLVLSLSAVLHRDDVLIMLERHGRDETEAVDVSRTVGWFTTMFPAHFICTETDFDKHVLSLKDQLRKVQKIGFSYGILRYLGNRLKEDLNRYVRFNFLGDVQSALPLDVDGLALRGYGLLQHGNPQSVEIDVIASIQSGLLFVEFSGYEATQRYVETLCSEYENTFYSLQRLKQDSGSLMISPSDFPDADLSQEEIRQLFI